MCGRHRPVARDAPAATGRLAARGLHESGRRRDGRGVSAGAAAPVAAPGRGPLQGLCDGVVDAGGAPLSDTFHSAGADVLAAGAGAQARTGWPFLNIDPKQMFVPNLKKIKSKFDRNFFLMRNRVRSTILVLETSLSEGQYRSIS